MAAAIRLQEDFDVLPSRAEHAGHRSLDSHMGIGDHQLDGSEAAAGQFAEELDTKRRGHETPISILRTSRLPSELTPTAMINATETIRR